MHPGKGPAHVHPVTGGYSMDSTNPTSADASSAAPFTWQFHRLGGLDQVTLQTSEELLHLDQLDPKLWVALSCPADSLQFDSRTLQLIDADKDGRVRVMEVVNAVQWTAERLKDITVLVQRRQDLPLARVREDTEEGRLIRAAAHLVLKSQNKERADTLTREDVENAMGKAAQTTFNGDGIITAASEFDSDIRRFITDIVNTLGGVQDASGDQGANQELARQFVDQVQAYSDWRDELHAAASAFPLGEATPDAFALYQKLAAKIDDYFVRCQLASFDPHAGDVLNAPDCMFINLAGQTLSPDSSDVAALPLAHIASEQPLPLGKGLNPAWRKDMSQFQDQVLTPLLGEHDNLPFEDWQRLKNLFAPYKEVADRKPDTPEEQLGLERMREILSSDVLPRFEALVQQDIDGKEEIDALGDVEQLVLYHAHLHQLLMNFVSFYDFYALSRSTTFQIGTLFLDGRSCHLCLRVDDIEKHASLARLSNLYLVYCQCSQKDSTKVLNIVSAVTAGDADLLIPGRHGVFVDSTDDAWDATVIKLVDNPISIRTSIFTPYRRIGRTITQQVEKLTASKNDALIANASKTLEKYVQNPAIAKPLPFDLGKSMGIFAAIGLALGAIGTALASLAAALLSLSWWQLPLLLIGIFVLISGPSMFMAWLKLRKRTLGPVLDASGWAVNSQIPINFMMGHFLTGSATLPPNIQRAFNDPYTKPRVWKPWLIVFFLLCVVLGALGAYWGWHLYTEHRAASVAVPPAASSPAQPPKPSRP